MDAPYVLSAPATVILELTYRCPGACPGCPSRFARSGRAELDGGRWREVIRALPPEIDEVHLTGGEPSLHPDFFAIVGALEKRRLPYRIFTNGLWPAPARIIAALERAKSLRELRFALHGATALTHEAFTGLTGFDALVSSIGAAVRRRLPVTTASIAGAFNARETGELVRLAARLGSRTHHVLRYLGPLRERVTLAREELLILLKGIASAPEAPIPLRIGGCFPDCYLPGSSRCSAGFTSLVIDPYGEVRPCPFLEEFPREAAAGSLDRIWKGEAFDAWRRDVPRGCESCAELSRCMGGCRTNRRNFAFRRDHLMEEPFSEPAGAPGSRRPLPAGSSPRFEGTVRPEPFGYALVYRGDAVLVSAGALGLVQLCDGTRTCAELERLAGKAGADFLASLHRRGFLEEASP